MKEFGNIIRLAFAIVAFALAGEARAEDALTQIPDILQLSGGAANRAVDITGTVYFHDSLSGTLFLGQGSDFIRISNQKWALQAGTTVRVLGKTGVGENHPTVVARKLNVVSDQGAAALVEPRTVEFRTLEARLECHWVVARGKVEGIRLRPGQTVVSCRQGESTFLVSCPWIRNKRQAADFLGRRVRVTGNLGRTEETDAPWMVFCPPERIEVTDSNATERSDTSLLNVPVRTIDELWNDGVAEQFRLWGQVTFARHDAFFLETSDNGTFISSPPCLRPAAGDYVEVFGGRQLRDEGGGSLHAKLLDTLGAGPLSEPRTMDASDVVAVRPESRRIRVRGEFQTISTGDGQTRITLRSDESQFDAYLDGEPFAALNLDSARQLEVTGTCSMIGFEGSEFTLHTPSLDDVRVISRTSKVNRKNVVLAISGIAGVLALALLRGSSLRSEVRAGKRNLAELTALLQRSHDSSREGILVLAGERILHSNRTLRELLSIPPSTDTDDLYESIEDTLSRRIVGDQFLPQFRRLNRDPEASSEFRLCLDSTAGESAVLLELFTAPVTKENGEFVARFWAFYDVTEKERLQERLLHAKKQEAVGRMAGGLAHDFNNLLTGIKGNLFLARMDQGKTVEQIEEHLQAADGAAERAANLVSQLMTFSRKKRLHLATYDLNDVVNRMLPLLRPALPDDESLVVELQDDLPEVRVDGIQIEQVLLNICLNACDAIRDGGTMTIETSTEIARSELHAVVSIRDTGSGIAPDVLPHIFEPFFTTKNSEGTGLGLATAEGIIDQHHGWIDCESRPRVGTEFRIFLPCSTTALQRAESNSLVESEAASIRSLNGLNVLVVDDEDVVRKAIARILRTEGVTVHTAARGEEALQLLEECEKIDLVLLDWRMPGMNGQEVLRRIKLNYASIPTIICSGYVVDCEKMRNGSDAYPDAILQKPFSVAQVAKAARTALLRAGR